MKQKIYVITIIAGLIFSSFNLLAFASINQIPDENEMGKIIKTVNLETPHNRVFAMNDTGFPYKDDDNESFAFGYEFFKADWDPDRKYWRYRFRFNWYLVRFDPIDYYSIEVKSVIAEDGPGIVPNSGNDFDHGGYNCSEINSGNFSEWGRVVCDAVISVLPWVNLFQSGFELASVIKDHFDYKPETKEYEWFANYQGLREASGFYQYDVYLKPGYDYDLYFSNIFITKRWDPNQSGQVDQDYCEMMYHFSGRAPDHCTFEPSIYKFEEVKKGECSEEKEFTITNDGEKPCEIKDFNTCSQFVITDGLQYEDYTLEKGESINIKIKFCPTSAKYFQYDFFARVGFSDFWSDGGTPDNNAYIIVSGVGKPKARIRNLFLFDILSNYQDTFLLFQRLF